MATKPLLGLTIKMNDRCIHERIQFQIFNWHTCSCPIQRSDYAW